MLRELSHASFASDGLVDVNLKYTLDGVRHNVNFDYDLEEDPTDVAVEFARECGYPTEEMTAFADFLRRVRSRFRASDPTAAFSGLLEVFYGGAAAPVLSLAPDGQQHLGGGGGPTAPSSSSSSSSVISTTLTARPPASTAHAPPQAYASGGGGRESGLSSSTAAATAAPYYNNGLLSLSDEDDSDSDGAGGEEQRLWIEASDREYEKMRARAQNIHEDRLGKLSNSKDHRVATHAGAAAKFEKEMQDAERKERDITQAREDMRKEHERLCKKYEKEMQDYDVKQRIEQENHQKRLSDVEQQFRIQRNEFRRRHREEQEEQRRDDQDDDSERQRSDFSEDFSRTDNTAPPPPAATPAAQNAVANQHAQ